MKIVIESSAKEMADLIVQLQGQREDNVNLLVEALIKRFNLTAEGGVIPLTV